MSTSSETESSTEEGTGLPCTPCHSSAETKGTQSFSEALSSESGGHGFAERPILDSYNTKYICDWVPKSSDNSPKTNQINIPLVC